jgi:hypothetical protein
MGKNKNIAFHGGNESAIEVYKRVKSKTRAFSDELNRPYYAWETIKRALDCLESESIALDPKTYQRLSKLAAQLRIDNPGGGFVSMSAAVGVLLDKWEQFNKIKVILFSPDMELSDFVKKVVRSAVDDISESNDPNLKKEVTIKDGANRYIENATIATANFFLTDDKSSAMVFDDIEAAKVFLHSCGNESGNWIIEPA